MHRIKIESLFVFQAKQFFIELGPWLGREAVEAAQAGEAAGQAQPSSSPSAPGVSVVLGQLLPPPVPLGVLGGLEPLSEGGGNPFAG